MGDFLKGYFTQKWKFWVKLFTHAQVVPNLYECLCSAEHKGRYSEECGKQSSSGAPLTSIVFVFPTMEVNGAVLEFLLEFLCYGFTSLVWIGIPLSQIYIHVKVSKERVSSCQEHDLIIGLLRRSFVKIFIDCYLRQCFPHAYCLTAPSRLSLLLYPSVTSHFCVIFGIFFKV